MDSPPPIYGEKDREQELETAPTVSVNLPFGPPASLTIQLSQGSSPGSILYLVHILSLSRDTLAFSTHESLDEDILYTQICRAAAFPMSPMALPSRPHSLRLNPQSHTWVQGPPDHRYILTRLRDRLFNLLNIALDIPSSFIHTSSSYCRACHQAPEYLTANPSLQRCAGCRHVHYCGPICQRRDWSEGAHSKACRLLKSMPLSLSPISIPSQLARSLGGATVEDWDHVLSSSSSSLPWSLSVLQGLVIDENISSSQSSLTTTKDPIKEKDSPNTSNQAKSTHDSTTTSINTSLLSSPFSSSSAYASAPRAISSWKTYIQARGLPPNSPLLPGLWPALSLYHILVCMDTSSLHPIRLHHGLYLPIHILLGPYSDPRWSSLAHAYSALLPFFPGITLDLFLLHSFPLPKGGRPSLQWMNNSLESCVRVHHVPAPSLELPPSLNHLPRPILSLMGPEDAEKLVAQGSLPSSSSSLVISTSHPVHASRFLARSGPLSSLPPGLSIQNPFHAPLSQTSERLCRQGLTHPYSHSAQHLVLFPPK
ncbi:MAG: hypothetical protein DHS80DRAFT_25813 [Piptocephalis tieghemiana]|nr:MAG: hypothetical protein DHS80DRAFT_25813 [Piptocephalis tieghemiana]